GVVYEDGYEDEIDVLVGATGFSTGLAELLDVPGAVDEQGRPRFRSGRQTPNPGLYFIGFDETTRGVLYEANRDSRRLARDVQTGQAISLLLITPVAFVLFKRWTFRLRPA